MIRILINSQTDQFAADYTKKLKSEYGIISRLTELKNRLSSKKKFRRHVAYISLVIANIDDILLAKPGDFDTVIPVTLTEKEFRQPTPPISTTGKGSGKRSPIPFYMVMISAMGYDWARNHLLPSYMGRLGIKSCVYCNAQYGITVKKDDGTYTSSYEFDHFKPKSVYPHLSASFYNLQPSCGHCNKLKWRRDAKFNLYTETSVSSRPLKFSLEKAGILKYLLYQDESNLNIVINASESGLLESQENLFKISKKYEAHKDEAAELIVLSRIYNQSFLRQLNNSIREQNPQYHDKFLDVILGFPTDDRHVHKRPLTLMKQDIAKQLGLL